MEIKVLHQVMDWNEDVSEEVKGTLAGHRICMINVMGSPGAGKTTMMRLICDILKPTSGEVTFNGTNIREMGESYRAAIGYLPQDFGYYPNFTAMNFLLYMASLKGLNARYAKEKSLELLETVNLSEVKISYL